MIIPDICQNRKCSKPPTSSILSGILSQMCSGPGVLHSIPELVVTVVGCSWVDWIRCSKHQKTTDNNRYCTPLIDFPVVMDLSLEKWKNWDHLQQIKAYRCSGDSPFTDVHGSSREYPMNGWEHYSHLSNIHELSGKYPSHWLSHELSILVGGFNPSEKY